MDLRNVFPHLPVWTPLFLTTWTLYFSALGLEKFLAYRRGRFDYDHRETLTNTFLLFIFALTTSFWGAGVLAPFFDWIRDLSPFALFRGTEGTFSGVSLSAYFLLVVLDDLCFYIYHRLMHASRWGWAVHDPHHSCSRFNITVAAREPWIAIFFSGVFWAPLALLGFDGQLILFQQWVNFSIQLLQHFDGCPRLGIFEFIFNTPTHHRIHHGLNLEYRDKNFGGVFIIWDRLFGTFASEKAEVVFGTETPPPQYSPMAISFNGIYQIFRRRTAGEDH
jgi:sterol desaturase/sphingolipid hydroxylase (fatty acid hydroxylase superfamily)